MAHLLKYDSVLGRLGADIQVADDGIKVDGDTLKVLAYATQELPWGDLGVDVVLESTGIFTARDKAAIHLEAGAPIVIVSAPSSGADATSSWWASTTTRSTRTPTRSSPTPRARPTASCR